VVKLLSHFWAAAVGFFADSLTCPEDAERGQNLIFSEEGREEKFPAADQSMLCGSDRQVCLFKKTKQIKIFPPTTQSKPFWKEFTTTTHCLISELLVLPVPRPANHLLGYVKMLTSR